MTPNHHQRNRHQQLDGAAAQGRELLKSMSGAIKLVSLYNSSHPVAVSTVEQVWKFLQQMQTTAPLAIGLVEGRWIIAGTDMGEIAQPTEAFAAMFRRLEMRTVLFAPGVRLFEVTAFCKLAAVSAISAERVDPAGYLKQAGAQHIHFETAAYSRVAATAKAMPSRAPVANPIPAPDVSVRPETRFSGLAFGTFIKGLVDNAVADPEERARIYGEALSQVKSALARRVSEAISGARRENQVISLEMARTEKVLVSMADGKVIVDRDGRVLMMDAVAEEISGKRLIDMAGKPLKDSIVGDGTVVSMSDDLTLTADSEPSHQMHTTGSQELLAAIRHSTAVVHNEQGRIVGTCSVLPGTTTHEESVRQHKEFVSHLTHELNAPLASICASLELVADMASSKLTAQEAHFIDVSLRNSRLLKQMISEILDFSKLQSGKMTVNPAAIPAAGILSEAAEALQPWAASKGLTLEVAVSPGNEDLMVLADHGRVVQIMTNLIANSIKSTPAGGRIVLAANALPQTRRVVISVKDNGCGILKEDQAKIFQRFTQGDGGQKRREGVGLGLTIVKELVDLHNGKLWLESESGQGACFFFSLPLVGAGISIPPTAVG